MNSELEKLDKIGKEDWFYSWFDSPLYQLLYHKRNDEEATHFIKNLLRAYKVLPGSKVLDVPCGNGRHSAILTLNEMKVVGLDLSPNSIGIAKERNLTGADFFVHDMREPFAEQGFDLVLNLFTSVGYFSNEEDEKKVFKAFHHNLKQGGLLVVDYFNSNKVIRELVSCENKYVKGKKFSINRMIEDGKIIKIIRVNSQGKELKFTERVSAFKLEDFRNLMSGFDYVDVYGDYDLNRFDIERSPRLIIVAKKI